MAGRLAGAAMQVVDGNCWRVLAGVILISHFLVRPVAAADKAVIEQCLRAADFEGCYRTLGGQSAPGQAERERDMRSAGIDLQAAKRQEKIKGRYSVAIASGGECQLVAYESVLDVCGTLVARTGIEEWTRSHVQTSCNWMGWCPGEEFNYGLAYRQGVDQAALLFTIKHRPTAYGFDKFFASWTGRLPRRAEGDKRLEPGTPVVAPIIVR